MKTMRVRVRVRGIGRSEEGQQQDQTCISKVQRVLILVRGERVDE